MNVLMLNILIFMIRITLEQNDAKWSKKELRHEILQGAASWAPERSNSRLGASVPRLAPRIGRPGACVADPFTQTCILAL